MQPSPEHKETKDLQSYLEIVNLEDFNRTFLQIYSLRSNFTDTTPEPTAFSKLNFYKTFLSIFLSKLLQRHTHSGE